jgi:hypothetical protein
MSALGQKRSVAPISQCPLCAKSGHLFSPHGGYLPSASASAPKTQQIRPCGVITQGTMRGMENRMLGFTHKVLMALLLCGGFVLGTPALAQAVDEKDATAGPTLLTQPSSASDQPTETVSPPLGQGTKAQAEHSAEATAHKSVNDPNNQLGTSLQGRTRPIAGADVNSQNDTASPHTPEPSAQ